MATHLEAESEQANEVGGRVDGAHEDPGGFRGRDVPLGLRAGFGPVGRHDPGLPLSQEEGGRRRAEPHRGDHADEDGDDGPADRPEDA